MNHFHPIFRACLVIYLPLLLSFTSKDPTPTAEQAAIQLPLEVIGANGYTKAVAFSLSNASGVNTLYLKAHRLAYYDASTNPGRGAKGSVKINDGPWINLDNGTVNCYDHEAAYGCLSGAYHTVRFTLPISGAVTGENTLRFRFNGTDGLSSGYRILEFNLRRGSKGANRLSDDTFLENDPANWQPPLANSSDIRAGKNLWETATLRESPNSPESATIKATCSGCHAQDGRDLEYFAFSNRSIQERAKFHGLSQKEARQIASYIRNLKAKGVKRLGRPWNPPYQPGPGLDSKPVEEWAAGAGLDWVLEEDADMVQHTFGGSITAQRVASVLDIEKTQNVRETPLSIQLPDWLEWLPEVHPVDAPRIEDKFYTAKAMHDEPVYDTYLRTLDLLNDKEVDALAANGQLKRQMNQLAEQLTNMNSKQRAAFNYLQKSREGVLSYLLKWGATKTWEIMQTYNLEEQAPALFGEYGEPRSWLSTRRNVFEIAPHRAANNKGNMQHQDALTGKYFSTAWYHLQLVLNAGNREALQLWPVDWNYQPNHISDLHTKGGPKHPYRYVVSHAKMFQQYSDGKAVGESSIGFRQIHPGRYAPVSGDKAIFTDLNPATRAQLYAGMLNATMNLIEQHENSEWPRDTLDRNDNTLRPATYRPKTIAPNRFGKELHAGRQADAWFTMIPSFREAGVDETTLNRLTTWGKAIWPMGDWEALRAEESTAFNGTYQLLARHSGKALAVDLSSNTNGGYDDPTADGVNIIQYGSGQDDNRLWEVEAVGDGYYKLTNKYSNKALALDLNPETNGGKADPTADGTNVFQYGSNNADNRMWKIESLDDNYYKLTNKYSGKVLDVSGRSKDNGANVHQWSCGGGTNQQWKLVLVDANARVAGGTVKDLKDFSLIESGLLRAYPNPATEQLTVEAAGGEDYQVTMYDLTGRLMMQHDRLKGKAALDISRLHPGVYVVKMDDGVHPQLRQRIIVE